MKGPTQLSKQTDNGSGVADRRRSIWLIRMLDLRLRESSKQIRLRRRIVSTLLHRKCQIQGRLLQANNVLNRSNRCLKQWANRVKWQTILIVWVESLLRLQSQWVRDLIRLATFQWKQTPRQPRPKRSYLRCRYNWKKSGQEDWRQRGK